MLIATAGHVDHGKTALVKALTGVDTDRLPAEQSRGLTIDLGFAYQTPAGGRRLGFVDVPGHERFVRNMLAGVAAIDLLLLVIAADDGPMPQTREHLAIACLLGIRRAAVALTKVDRTSPARVSAAAAEIEQLLAATPLAGAKTFPVSSPSGAGVGALADYLEKTAAELPQRPVKGHFRLAIDRSFSIAGAGVVVTGAVFSGGVVVGERLRLLPGGQRVRVRAIHSQGLPAQQGRSGERCALNIVGHGKSVGVGDLQRGDWLVSPEQTLLTERADVRLRLLPGERRNLRQLTPVHVHSGSGSRTGRVALLDTQTLYPGRQALAQLVLDRPALLVFGERFVLRDQSARRTLGGGYVIDPLGLKRGRGRAARVELLRSLDTDDHRRALQASLDKAPQGVALADFANSRNLNAAERQALYRQVAMVSLTAPNGQTVALSAARWQVLHKAVHVALERWHARYPDRVGVDMQSLREACAGAETPPLFAAAVQALVRSRALVREGLYLRLPRHRPQLGAADRRLFERISGHFAAAQLKPPALKDLARLLDLPADAVAEFLERTAKRGLLVRVSATRYFHPAALESLAHTCQRLAERAPEGLFDARGFRDAAQIGRNAAVEVLEYFDATGLTHRCGDRRRLNPRAPNAQTALDAAAPAQDN